MGKKKPLIYSVSKYLSVYFAPDTVLDAGGAARNKAIIAVFRKLTSDQQR